MTDRNRMLEKIERFIELEYNQLDLRLANNEIDHDLYTDEVRAIDDWARDMYNDMDKV
jgi:hypothetical protein